MKKFSGVR